MGYNDIKERVFSSFQNPTNKETDAMANTHKRVAGVLLVLVAVALLGAGCKGESQQAQPENPAPDAAVEATPVADAGSEIPEGWQIYRNPAWGIEQLAYPEGWYWREADNWETGLADMFAVDFDDENFFPTETEAFHPLTISVRRGGTIAEEEQFLEGIDILERSVVTISGRQFHRWVTRTDYGGEMLENTSYLVEINGLLYDLSGNGDSAILDQFVTTLTISGGE